MFRTGETIVRPPEIQALKTLEGFEIFVVAGGTHEFRNVRSGSRRRHLGGRHNSGRRCGGDRTRRRLGRSRQKRRRGTGASKRFQIGIIAPGGRGSGWRRGPDSPGHGLQSGIGAQGREIAQRRRGGSLGPEIIGGGGRFQRRHQQGKVLRRHPSPQKRGEWIVGGAAVVPLAFGGGRRAFGATLARIPTLWRRVTVLPPPISFLLPPILRRRLLLHGINQPVGTRRGPRGFRGSWSRRRRVRPVVHFRNRQPERVLFRLAPGIAQGLECIEVLSCFLNRGRPLTYPGLCVWFRGWVLNCSRVFCQRRTVAGERTAHGDGKSSCANPVQDLMKMPFMFISSCCGLGENFRASCLLMRPAFQSR